MMAANRSRSSRLRADVTAGADVSSDPTALALLRSAQLSAQRRQDRLLAEVAELRRQSAALGERRAELARRLAESQPDSRRQEDSFTALGRQTVWRHVGVWAAAGGGRRTVLRLRTDPGHEPHTLQLEWGGRQGVTATVRDLPPGVQLESHLLQHRAATQQPALLHAVATEVDAFASRRRQVDELRAALPGRRSQLWHDPAICDVSLQLELNVSGERRGPRVPVELSMRYAAGEALPHQCRLIDAQRLDKEDREELMQLTENFLRLPLREAFREAFQ